MLKVMYNDKLVYKIVIWLFFEIRLWKEKGALTSKHTIIEYMIVKHGLRKKKTYILGTISFCSNLLK